ncbi:MAG TPA: TonB family protein [Chitinophagales bacterium]|nr:TonB family protein [Chitinophagales bacterium]
MSQIDYKKLSMDEIVFEQRNKSYGAFELRQLIDRHKIKGLLIAIAFFTFVVLASQFKIFSFLGKLTKEKEVNIEMTDVDLPPPPPPPVDAPPPPPPPPPPVRPTIKFVEMIAKKDEEVAKQEEIVKQEDIKVDVSTTTQKGDENAKAIIEDKPGTGTAVVSAPEPEAPKEPEIFDRAEVMPNFPGGIAELMGFLKKNILYPSLARENGLEGKVIVKFYVDTDGTVREPVVLKDGVGGGCADEAIRVIKKMPKWTPGTQRGKPVKVYYTLPVSFKLS